MAEKEICRGQCLFGKCPYKECVKYKTGSRQPLKNKERMEVMQDVRLDIGRTGRQGYGLAVDIGTTTIAALLYNLADARPAGAAGAAGALNDQVSFGLDVISRIKYCGDHTGGLKQLHDAVVAQLNGMIDSMCASAKLNSSEIRECVITGNTTMLHLLDSLSPVSMGVLPFTPLSYFGGEQDASKLGLCLRGVSVYLPPCVSAFVGADITCDMLYAGFAQSDKTYLLMDIGTNGEVALLHDGKILSSSTAAGPAFEGAHISCGMAGVEGAINKVYALDGGIGHTTIGGKPARGLCGSGLLDAVAMFARAGAIDETGRIAVAEGSPYAMESDGQAALRVVDSVFLTQRDVREIQNAKAAVAGGVKTLLHEAGVGEDAIDMVFLAGGFGNYMDVESAREIGLVPRDVPVKTIGNAAAAGAAMLLLDNKYRKEIEWIKGASSHVELGGNPYFMEQYMECMFF